MLRRTTVLRSTLVLAVATAVGLTPAAAFACDAEHVPGGTAHAEEGPSATSAQKNVELVGTLPDAQGAIALQFLQYGYGHRQRDVLVVSGEFGLKTYDLTADPARPTPLGELSMPGMWETEDTEVDPVRKLVFLARDPRAFGGNTQTGESGIYTVDLSDPARPELASYVRVPAGHTTSCVNDCRYLWTGGPAKAASMPEDWGGRPIWVTDVRDPRNPKVFPEPIDLGRNDGKTDYVHDVQVDAHGVAWTSGRGGVRGYWTSGMHRDPVTGGIRWATPWEPVPYAGGGVSELAAASTFMHNSYRPVGRKLRDGGDVRHGRPGELIYVTEEAFEPGCANDGVLVIASLRGSYQGQGWRSTPEDPFRLETVGTWGVAGQEGSDPDSGNCSAHYFDVRGDILVQSFYAQGTRFLDVSDPTNPTQVAYHRAADAASWAPYWHRGLVYVADNNRGVDILRLTR
ncbi:hypothetical protein SAMN05421810_101561 [Amycolatopsis arida]|uniref:LVIVD repeat-containing protein n=1 Tax=Amycolatopsis arida TaxID=587909 RepID=A0A1I5LKG3_9PSEU|nr:hypothetical protein [Amycolatopsis arida]TDX93738.1 hypothetical protein CLV69_104194 [Amycolatopsis arida]SFO97231.1 hypothetical protein SAMN05421810_101561 [Amycolatopsis arida]